MRGIEYHFDLDRYRADPCEIPSLSQSIAKILVGESEEHARRAHPRLGGHYRPATKVMDVGTICHALMLGQPLPEIELIPYDTYQTRDARLLRDLAIDCGKIPLKNAEYGEQGKIFQRAELLREKLGNMGFTFDPDRCEVAMFWSKYGAQCKGRIDNLQGFRAIDLKFTACAHPDFIDRQVSSMGHNIQAASYTEAINELVPEADGRGEFLLLFCETEPPYCITPATMSPEQALIGQVKWAYAQRRWAECLATGVWHEYMAPGEIHMVEAKPWELTRAIERYGDIDETPTTNKLPILSDVLT